VFDDGRIVEDGSHAELLARGGAYHRLWSRQAGGFLPEAIGGEATAMKALAALAAPAGDTPLDDKPAARPEDEPGAPAPLV
jgi:ATP-binding cassette subfamily B protein